MNRSLEMTTVEGDVLSPDDHNDFDLEVLAARRRRRLPLVTAALAVGVIAAAAFIGGVEIQKHYGGSSGTGTAGGTGAFAAARSRAAAGGTSTGAARGGFGAAAGVTAGTVTVIKGKTLYVTDTSGNTVKVTTSAASRVTKTVSSTVALSSIKPGSTVVVQGTTQKNGNIAASSISLGTGGAGFGAGSGFFGRSGRGSSSGGTTSSGGATGFGG
jgi:hypothetical protein